MWIDGRKAEDEIRGLWSSRKNAATEPSRQCWEPHGNEGVHYVLAEWLTERMREGISEMGILSASVHV